MKPLLNLLWQYFKKLDKQLFIFVTGCGLFSVILIYSIVQNRLISYLDSSHYKTQLIAVCIGAIAALILSAIDYHWIAKLWFIYVPITLIMVGLTFTSLGIQRGGADDKAWIDLGITTLQPSEFLKLAFILSFSYHLSKVNKDINKPISLLLLCLHGAAPVLLIFAQGDGGTALVFFFVFLIMLFSAGLSIKYIITGIISIPVFSLILWFLVLQPVHKKRILILFNPEMDPLGIGNQQRQGKIALGSGQLFGKGLMSGEYSYVSEVHNDFIFSFIGQALGFVGCMALIGVLCYICLKLIANSRIAKDALGKSICIGVFSLIFVHSVLNIGMVLGILPVIGVPLPFTSGGGTAMLSMYAAIGLAMSTYSHSGKKYAVFYDAG